MKKIILSLAIVLMGSLNAQAQNLNDSETKGVFDLIFGAGSSADLIINNNDKQVAYKLLNELIEKSCQMSVAEGLMRSAYSYNRSISRLAMNIIRSNYSNCSKGAKEGRYYESVRVTIVRNWSSAFQIRKQTGEW